MLFATKNLPCSMFILQDTFSVYSVSQSETFRFTPHIKTPERSDWIPNMTGSNLFDQIKHVVNIYVRPGSLHPASCIQYCKQQAMCQPLDIFEIFLQNKSRKKKTLCPEAGAALLTRDNYYDWSVQSDGAAWCINISRVPSPV